MIRRLCERLTYANVIATLALFIALGGSSYAALTLPRNSVGATQIRAAAVGTGELRDRSIAVTDMSLAARRSLRGKAGPAGPAGPAGAPATRYFTSVSAAGGLVRGNATGGGRAGVAGSYTVVFPQPVSGCAMVASLGSTDASEVPAGSATTGEQNGQAVVHTFNAAGAATDLPFHLIVSC